MDSLRYLTVLALLICLTNFAHGGKRNKGSGLDEIACEPGSQLYKTVSIDDQQGCRLCQCHEDYGWACTEKVTKCARPKLKSKLCTKREVSANEKLIDCYKCSCNDNLILKCDPLVTGLKEQQCRQKLNNYNTNTCVFCSNKAFSVWN